MRPFRPCISAGSLARAGLAIGNSLEATLLNVKPRLPIMAPAAAAPVCDSPLPVGGNENRPMAKPADIQRRLRVLVVQTQAENAGAQEISRLVGAGLTARGFDVHHLFFFRKTRSFDEPPNTSYCAPHRAGTPLAFLRFLWTLGRRIR